MTYAEVIGRVLNGERHQFTQLIHRYQDRIYGLAYHYMNHFEDARDIAQDAFIRAYRQIQTLREPAKFGHWLKQLTIHECRMRNRERTARKEEALTEAHEGILFATGGSDDIAQKLALQQAMAALPEANRLILTLFYFYSYSLEELAEFLASLSGYGYNTIEIATGNNRSTKDSDKYYKKITVFERGKRLAFLFNNVYH